MSPTRTPTTADLDAAVAHLRQRLTAAARHRVRAEMERDAAQQVLDATRAQLAERYGVHDPEQATATLTQLREQLAAAAARVSSTLDDLGIA